MGSSFIAGKILILSGIPAILLVSFRFLFGALFALPLLNLEPKPYFQALFPPHLTKKQKLAIFLIGLFQTGGAMGFLFLAMRTITASNAAILLFTNPLWVSILGRIFLGERASPLRIFGLIIGISGVSLAMGGAILHSGDIFGHFVGLCAAFCWAIATTINKRMNLPIGIWTLSFWQMFIGGVVLLCFALAMGQTLPIHFEPKQILWFLWLAGPGSTASFSLWFIALRKGGATTASSFLFLAPLFAVILSFLIMGAKLSFIQAIGGIMVGLAIYLINHTPPKNARKTDIQHEAESMGEP